MAWIRGDEKASLCTVGETREASHPGRPSSKADQTGRAPLQGLLPGLQASEEKGCGSEERLGALLRQAPDPHPTPGRAETRLLWPGPQGPLWRSCCLSTSERDGNGCASQRLSGEGEVGDR